MKKQNLNLKLLPLAVAAIFAVGCGGAKVTFQPVYSTEMSEKQNEGGHFDESNGKFVGVASKGLLNAKTFTVLDMADGDILYSKAAKDMSSSVEASPSYNIDFATQTIFLSSKYLTYRTITAVDLITGEELWSKSTQDEDYGIIAGSFETEWFDGLPVIDNNGLKILNSRTGEIDWSIGSEDGINIAEAYDKGKSQWKYWPERNILLVTNNDQYAAINTKNGNVLWTLSGEYGNMNECDLFFERDKALFYGPQGGGASETIGDMLLGSSKSVGRIAGRAIRTLNSGIQDNPLYYIDLQKGKLIWETTFKTSGQTFPYFYEDMLILSDLFTYALDAKTGEVIWQTVEEQRLDNEDNRRLVSEFTPFKLDASNRVANDNIIVDDNIFVVHSTIFDEGGDKESISLKRLNINTGEEIWASEPEKLTITNFFFKDGRLFVQTGNRSLVPNGEIRALNAGTGELLYEIKARSTIFSPFITNYHLHFKDYNSRLQSYDVQSGREVSLTTPQTQTMFLNHAGDFIFGGFTTGFGGSAVLAFLNPQNFAVERQVEIPFVPSNKETIGGYYYMHERTDNSLEIIAIDFDKLENRGTYRKKTSTKKTQNGSSVDTMPEVHYYISNDGENVYVTEDKSFTKYKLKK